MIEPSPDTAGTLHLDPLAFAVAVEGAALMRAFAGEHDSAFVERRLAAIEALLANRDQLGAPADLPQLTAAQGYDAWSIDYDEPGNGLLAPDFERVTAMIQGHPGGRAIDIACGTGRYAEWLVGQGYQVIGVDGSPGMLSVARRKLPQVDFRDGDLAALPVPSGSAELAVCALALTHVQDLAPVYAEFARVLTTGGRLVVSDTHSLFRTASRYPLIRQLPDGTFGYLPGWEHSLVDHVTAALAAGFSVQRVEEFVLDGIVDPSLAPEDLRTAAVPDPWPLMTWVSEAANAAWTGAPASMYLQLERTSWSRHR